MHRSWVRSAPAGVGSVLRVFFSVKEVVAPILGTPLRGDWTSVADSGEGPKGPGPSPLILSPKWGLKGRKTILLRPPPPSISGSGWWPGTPPYLKVWIRHCTCCAFKRLKQTCCNSCVWRDSYVILSNQRLVFTQLATSWFVARQA